jgi:glycosyltransferase involved in cell wall biosynthesis
MTEARLRLVSEDYAVAPRAACPDPLEMTRLSVIIVAKNEALNIVDCVRSASFADEVLVLDSGSTDGTGALAESAGARVVVTDWPGYGAQNNRGIDLACGDWIFSLDADERISPALARAIEAAMTDDTIQGCRVPRVSMFAGRFIAHGGWRPDYTRRLVRRGAGRFTEHFLHANLQIQGRVGTLSEPIVHYSFRDLDSVLEKVNRYSSAGARDMGERGRRGSFSGAVFHGVWAFVRTYLLRLGFLDGRWGFMLAVSNAEGTYYRYLKLWLQQQPPQSNDPLR